MLPFTHTSSTEQVLFFFLRVESEIEKISYKIRGLIVVKLGQEKTSFLFAQAETAVK